jgi:hypothetical protein
VGKIQIFVLCRSSARAGRLELPFGQALAAPGQENGKGVGRADDTFAQLEEALDQLQRLDVRHGTQHRPAEALARRAGFTATRQGIEGFGDLLVK